MYLLLSGEGAGDMGACLPASGICSGENFVEGPMAIIVDQLIEYFQPFEMSHLGCELVGYVSESYLVDNKAPQVRKAMSLRGKKKPPETKYYYENARALAIAANNKSQEINDHVVAILFRDADGEASAGRGNWVDKHTSMLKGFEAERFDFGVAMVPNPKSEAWLLCAVKENPYQHCDSLEASSGNDSSSNSLKQQLSDTLNGEVSRVQVNNLLLDKCIDPLRISMSSFDRFKYDLERVVRCVNGLPVPPDNPQ